MANYVFVYKGGGLPEDQEQKNEVMAAWGKWYETLGKAVVDGGNPFSTSKTIAPGGEVSEGAASELSGYTIVSADSLDAAVAMAQDCPVRLGGATVEVYETFPVM